MMRRALCVGIACAFAAAVQAQAVDPLALEPEAAPQHAEAAPLGLRVELWRQQFDVRRQSATQPEFGNRAVLDWMDAHTRAP